MRASDFLYPLFFLFFIFSVSCIPLYALGQSKEVQFEHIALEEVNIKQMSLKMY